MARSLRTQEWALGIEGEWFGRYYNDLIQDEAMREIVMESYDTQLPQVRELTLGEEVPDRAPR